MPILCGVAEPSAAQLRTQLDGLTLRDAARIGRRLKNVRGASPEKLRQLADQVATAQAVIATRQAAVPTISYPDLPVSERRQEIAEAIRAQQVVALASSLELVRQLVAAAVLLPPPACELVLAVWQFERGRQTTMSGSK